MLTTGKASEASSQDQHQSLDKYFTQLDIVILVTVSCCAINHSLHSMFGEELSIDLSDWQVAREQMNTAGKTSEASLQDLCQVLGIHQG